jgi:hypothetical protein
MNLIDNTPQEMQSYCTMLERIVFITIITVFGLCFWISELTSQRDTETLEKLKYQKIAELQKDYFDNQLDTMVFYNDCGVRIELKENE